MIQMYEDGLGYEDYPRYKKEEALYSFIATTRSIGVREYARGFNPKTNDGGYAESDLLQNRLENTGLQSAMSYLRSVAKQQYSNERRIVALEKQLLVYKSLFSTLQMQLAALQGPEQLSDGVFYPIETRINALRECGFNNIADRLTNLHQTAMKEGEAIMPNSLQNFILFVVREPRLVTPEIGLNPDGCVQAVWQIPSYGSLAMDFLTSDDIMFSMLFYRRGSRRQKPRIGMSPMGSIMHNIGEFADMLALK